MGDVDALCRRIVIIDKGKKLYDNDIQHLRGFFGSYRTLKIRPKEEIKTAAAELEKELKDLDIKVSISDDNEWINLLVNEDKIKVLDVLSKVQSMHDIRDMQLEEISTEEVIKKIYEGGI
jgi:ABC-2 type transport system ATP-binding protein